MKNMRKKWKKVWCILLCMVMVLTAAPMQAYEVKAAENSGNEESTAPELIAEEPSQCPIVEIPESTTENGTETESGSEGESETEPETVSEPESASETETESELESASETETESEPESASETETESEPALESETETVSETETEEDDIPKIKLSAEAGGKAYTGGPTNEQVIITAEITDCLSGVQKVEAVYCEGESEPGKDAAWEVVEPDVKTGKYQVVVGEILEKKTIPDTTMDAQELTTEGETGEVQSNNVSESFIRNGKYYFRVLTKAGNESEENKHSQQINITQQNVEATASAYANITSAENGWYNQERPFIGVKSEELEKSESKLSIFLDVYKVKYENGEPKEEMEEQLNLSGADHQKVTAPSGEKYDYQVNEDGYYVFYVYAADEAGNIGEIKKYKADVDTEVSDNVSIKVSLIDNPDSGESIESIRQDTTTIQEKDESEEIIYSHFYGGGVKVEIAGEDTVSGINKAASSLTTNGGESVKLEEIECITMKENGRYYVKAEVADNAGNTATLSSGGFVVDDEAPLINDKDKLTIKSDGAGKNGFINKDCLIDVVVQDLPKEEDQHIYAGLKSVSYEITNSSGQVGEGTVLNSEFQSGTTEELNKYEKASGQIDIVAKEMEGNNVTVKVTAIDNAGNSKEVSTEVNIDVTQPEITVEFTDGATENGKYYTEDRTARVTIEELNFDPKEVKLEITKDGTAVPVSIGSWQSNGDIHTADINFTEDGEYSFKISCTDLAGNTAEGPDITPFTIDKTAPDVTISYNTTPYVEGYFNTAVIATVTVDEANFSEKDFKLIAEPQAAIGAWSHNGNIHTANITFREDGEYTWKVDCTDLAGNQMLEMKAENFIIDTVMPEVAITGVEDGSANAGEIAPVVTIADENLNWDDIEIKLTDGRGQQIDLEQKVTQIPQGFSYELTNVSAQKDSVYHLSVKGIDKAGNESEFAYRFSLNRNGSTFDFSSVNDIVARVYNKSTDITDIKILETNVDKIENFEIYINRNGKMIRGAAVSKRPSKYKSDAVYYTVNQRGDENIGYTYEYTIFRENFEEEGTYNITFSSVDRAGNRKNNTQATKEDTIGFIVDDMAPQVFIDGVEGDTVYKADELDVNVYVTDNFSLKDAEFYLVNESGETIEVWDYMELAEEAGDSITLTIPGSEERRSLLYRVTDEAGNEIVTKAGEKGVPSGFMITTEEVSQLQAADITGGKTIKAMSAASGASLTTPIVRFMGAVTAGVIMIGTAVVIGRRKRMKEFGENK